ncbi:MAG: electron transfer flavoprotein subunit alpha/FixB family protein [Gemmatimonadetes bacterium]|nr:MAG: electron transfer flavoprotein subunit alpha/FixB family protein [Gemmatimonadota bacterium]
MGDLLAFAEHRDGQLRGAANEAVSTAARLAAELGGAAHALVVGGPGVSAAAAELGSRGAATIRVAEHEALSAYAPEAYARVVADQVRAGGYAGVIFAATAQGKDLAPRVAALLDVPLVPDVTRLEVEDGALVATRPVYAGKAFATVTVDASPVLVSIRPNVFAAEERAAAGSVETFTPELPDEALRTRVVEFVAAEGGSLDVSEASVVVSGGRGMKDPSNWHLLEAVRDAIGPEAALGASRAVVDAGWRPHGEQVGQTGKTVAPKLYIAVGISGAIQHLAGMRTSGTIVAINRDPDAPIFNVADYGIVGDAMEVLPRLAEEIRALRAQG